MKNTLNHKLEMSGCLCKAHWHPEPPELAPVGNKCRVKRSAFEWDTVEASLQVQHADPLSLPKLCTVPPYVTELVLVLSYLFIDRDFVLTHPVWPPRLNTQY